jgi:hypothetical protein
MRDTSVRFKSAETWQPPPGLYAVSKPLKGQENKDKSHRRVTGQPPIPKDRWSKGPSSIPTKEEIFGYEGVFADHLSTHTLIQTHTHTHTPHTHTHIHTRTCTAQLTRAGM